MKEGMIYLLMTTILLLPLMASASPCPYGYYYMRMAKDCLPCEKLCNNDYDIECERRCPGFTTTTTVTPSPTPSPTITFTTESPSTETNQHSGKTDKTLLIVLYIFIGVIGLVLLGCLLYKKCKSQQRECIPCIVPNKPPNANEAVVTFQATQDKNQPSLTDPTAPGVSHPLLVPEENSTRPAD